jgi:2-oxoglutarate ferredoxin oxidoreductase subunit beta
MNATYLVPGATPPYCKGCSHGVALLAFNRALERLQLPPGDLAVVTDIGCVGLADAQFATPHTIHTTHGRSTAFAAGMALANATLADGLLKTVVMIGDGGAMIGLGHLVNAALLNPDVTVLVHNNFLFGMTGGQNSALTPNQFVTSTTPAGNRTPPLDLARVLLASRAPFVARKIATDRDLADVIARAIAHPGFAMVEIVELCPTFAGRWNALTGAQLTQMAEGCGYELGVLRDEPRPTFAATYRQQTTRTDRPPQVGIEPGEFAARLQKPVGIVLAGAAGEHVQSASALLAQAAMRSGLHVSQKNDYPVTQGSGFSLTELILSPEEILYTGIEKPDVVLVVSADGAKELERNGTLACVRPDTIVLAANDISLPELPCRIERRPFRSPERGKLAALAAVVTWLSQTQALPLEALWASIEARSSAEASVTRARLRPFAQAA